MTDNNDDHVATSELQKYRAVWSQPYYRTPSLGLSLYQHARNWFPATFDGPIIDIGCGRGHVVNTWLDESHDAWGLDITDNCIDPPLRTKILSRMLIGPVWNPDTWQDKRFSFGLCCDVMEHIPPEYVQQTLDVVMSHCDVVLFKIACFHNVIGPSDLHMTVATPSQWYAQLNKSPNYGTLEVRQMDDKDTCPYPYLVATVCQEYHLGRLSLRKLGKLS